MNKELRMYSDSKIRPMPLWMSVILFGFFSLFIALGIHVLVPFGQKVGIPVFISYEGPLVFSFLIGIAFVFLLFHLEKKRGLLFDTTFRERFWLPKPTYKDVLLGLGLTLFWIVTLVLMKGIISQYISMPSYLLEKEGTIHGVSIHGNIGLLVFKIVFLLLNVICEEFFWRGYMLPRQELQHGKKAWIVNGVLWSLFHLPMFWIAPALAPGCIALAFVTQKRRSIWPALIAHFLLNGADLFSTFAEHF